ncbi:phosphate transport system regulatory protein PhoU [Ruegeria lacuscaerulensis ITI-1157]|nr:phosphate transport system regulatory protein PhoU [Ruegeria lacuscaerulensis ITI-1157]SHJ71497.1 phosphate uptake regulator, PhoU [Ruegeria lacuscaerulensis ITI-1157]
MTDQAMKEKHIVRSFDTELEAVQAHLMRMGGLVETGLSDAITALRERDVHLAERTVKADRTIDELEELVKTEAANIIARRAPTAVDLRVVLATFTIANQLERSGDHAKNIAKRSITIAQSASLDEVTAAIAHQAKMVQSMLAGALDAFMKRDPDAAQSIRERDAEVDATYNTVFRTLLTHMMEDPANITPGMHLHFVAKNLERIGDHATGIAEQTIYLVSGELPDDDRPRRDQTPTETTEAR